MKKSLSIQAGVTLKATANGEPTKKRRFSIVAYTGSPLHLPNWEHPLYIDLDGLTASSQFRPALYGHNPTRKAVVGQIDKIHNNAPKDLVVEGFFLTSTQAARDVLEMAIDGFSWQASVGASVEEAEEVRAGATAEVNGITVEGPCVIARRSTLGEVSFVVMGADDRTSARITAKKARASRFAKGFTMTFQEWLASLGLDAATMSAEQLAELQKAHNKLYPSVEGEGEEDVEGEGEDDLTAEDLLEELEAEGEEDLEAENDEEMTAEDEEKPLAGKAKARRQTLLIQALQRQLNATGKKKKPGKTPIGKITAAARARAQEYRRIGDIEAVLKSKPKLLARALEEGWTVDKAKLEKLRASRAKAPLPQRGRANIEAKVIQAALLMTGGIQASKLEKAYGQETLNKAMEPEMRGISLHYLMDKTIQAAGEFYEGHRKTNGFIKAAMGADKRIRASSFSTMGLSSILEAVANKALIDAYQSIETTWQTFAAVRNLADFKVHNRYRLDATGAFRKVAPDGELKHIGLSDAKYELQADTWGALITLNRQMMINDDLGAFLQIPQMLGILGATSVEEANVLLLLSNVNNFFHANNRNLITGAGSAFSIGGLTLLENAFRNQIGPNFKPILMSPQRLLVPSTLSTEADNIYQEITVNETTATGKPSPARNPHKGKYPPTTSPYLNNQAIKVLDEKGEASGIQGQSDTAYYLFADPNVRAAFGCGFLNGVQTPTIESDETSFETLGRQWRAYLDFGVGQEDPTAAAKAAGQ